MPMNRDKMLDEIQLMAEKEHKQYAHACLWGMSRSLLSDSNIKMIYKILKENEVNV